MLKSFYPWNGRWRIEHLGRVAVVENRLTDAGLQWFIDLWRGTAEPGFKYIALGTDPTPVDNADITLGAEQIRRPVGSFEVVFPELESSTTFQDTEANFLIREIGLFAGATATADPDTGILVARAVVEIDKTDLGSLKITRLDRIGRV
ncbi:MAG: hypothetical protein K6T65_13350 [Peptococcaceae bacterium]|nr:hypothetical protein [Peptococcaceae bacterium]